MDFSLYGFEGLTKTYNVHPAFVHFPIALLPVTLLFYACGFLFRWQALLIGGRVCLYLSLLAVVVAVITGLRAQDSFPHNEMIHHMMDTHETTGLIVLGLTAALVFWSFWQKKQKPKAPWLFLAGTVLACYFVLQNGDLGSRMVYSEGAAVKPAVPYIGAEEHEHGHDHDHDHDHGATDHHHEDHSQPTNNPNVK